MKLWLQVRHDEMRYDCDRPTMRVRREFRRPSDKRRLTLGGICQFYLFTLLYISLYETSRNNLTVGFVQENYFL